MQCSEILAVRCHSRLMNTRPSSSELLRLDKRQLHFDCFQTLRGELRIACDTHRASCGHRLVPRQLRRSCLFRSGIGPSPFVSPPPHDKVNTSTTINHLSCHHLCEPGLALHGLTTMRSHVVPSRAAVLGCFWVVVLIFC